MSLIIKTDNPQQLLDEIKEAVIQNRLSGIHRLLNRPDNFSQSKEIKRAWRYNADSDFFQLDVENDANAKELKFSPQIEDRNLRLVFDHIFIDESADIEEERIRYHEDFVVFLLRECGTKIESVVVQFREAEST